MIMLCDYQAKSKAKYNIAIIFFKKTDVFCLLSLNSTHKMFFLYSLFSGVYHNLDCSKVRGKKIGNC